MIDWPTRSTSCVLTADPAEDEDSRLHSTRQGGNSHIENSQTSSLSKIQNLVDKGKKAEEMLTCYPLSKASDQSQHRNLDVLLVLEEILVEDPVAKNSRR